MPYPHSQEFADTITSTNQVAVFQADLYLAGTTTLVAEALQITGGQVQVDRTAATRRQCQFSIADDERELIPLLTGTNRVDLGPLEIRPYRGLQFPNGRKECIPQGVFRVSKATVTDEGTPTLQVTGYDRSRTVARAALTTTYVVANASPITSAISNLVDFCLPFDVPVNKAILSVDPATTHGTLVYHEQDNPWTHCEELGSVIGAEVFFDLDGWLTIQDTPDPANATDVAFQFIDGITSTMLSVQHDLDDEPGYNGVVVVGDSSQNTSTVPRALVVDNNPNSPTYWFGPYGRVPEFVTDSAVNSQQQATALAQGRLRQRLGWTETYVVACVPHPALTEEDLIGITRAPSGVDDIVSIEQMIIPFDTNTAMTMTCRTRRPVVT
jgi:Domain of unknown function (DUF5047)